MKYRLGMLVAAMALTVNVAFAQVVLPPATSTLVSSMGAATMDTVRASDGVQKARTDWLNADQAACNAWSVWANPFGEWAKKSGRDWNNKLSATEEYVGYRSNVYGMAAGIDRTFGSNLKIGLYTQLADGDFSQKHDAFNFVDDADADQLNWTSGIYGVYKWNKFFVEAKTAYIWNRNSYKDADQDQDGHGWQGAFNVGYQFVFGCDIKVTPTVGLDYIWLKNDSFYADRDYDVDGDLIDFVHYNSDTSTSLRLPLMVSIEKSFNTSFGSLTPFVRGGWIHEFHNNGNAITVRSYDEIADEVTHITDRSYDNPHDYGQVGLGVNANVNGRADIFAAWDYQWAKRYYSNNFNVGFSINF